MKNYKIIGFRFGVYTSLIINTTRECAKMRATQRGFEDILRIEEV